MRIVLPPAREAAGATLGGRPAGPNTATHPANGLRPYADLYRVPLLRHDAGCAPSRTTTVTAAFLILALVDRHGDVFVRPTPSGFELPWSYAGAGESAMSLAEALVHESLPHNTITDLAPMVEIHRTDSAGSVHVGLGCIARAIPLDGGQRLTGFLPAQNLAACALSPLHARVASLATARARRIRPIDAHEIVSAFDRRSWKSIHRRLVRPVAAPFSSWRLRRKILAHCDRAQSVIDVSCGDDVLILQIARHAELCVANDIATPPLRALARRDRACRLLFSLHDATTLQLSRRFDVALCKNTLHHLTPDETGRLFATVARLARRAVFVDIVDIASSRRARAWNAYYRHVLKDNGSGVLTEREFRSLLSQAFPGWDLRVEGVETIKGRYTVALVEAPAAGRRRGQG